MKFLFFLLSSVILLKCTSLQNDTNSGFALNDICPDFGFYRLDKVNKNALTPDGGKVRIKHGTEITVVPISYLTEAEKIGDQYSFDKFSYYYKHFCDGETPYKDNIAYIKTLKKNNDLEQKYSKLEVDFSKGIKDSDILNLSTDGNLTNLEMAYFNSFENPKLDWNIKYTGNQFDYEKNDKKKFQDTREKRFIIYKTSVKSKDYNFKKKILTIKPYGRNIYDEYEVLLIDDISFKMEPEAAERISSKPNLPITVLGQISNQTITSNIYNCNENGEIIKLNKKKFEILKSQAPYLALRCQLGSFKYKVLYLKKIRAYIEDSEYGEFYKNF
jgi:hypothetical protein